jgi:hypothetical protein
MGEEEERIRKMLRDAFANVPCPDDYEAEGECGSLVHEVGLELRKSFYNYEPEEIHYMLPSILEDLMDTRTGDDIETEDAERLIMQLDPVISDSAVVRKVQLQQFADFTPEQARAVCEWLRLARTWEDLSRFTDWVDSAIGYWCKRAGG